MTVSDVLAKPVATPATPAEVQVAVRMLDKARETGQQIVRVLNCDQVSLIFSYPNTRFIDDKIQPFTQGSVSRHQSLVVNLANKKMDSEKYTSTNKASSPHSSKDTHLRRACLWKRRVIHRRS